MTRQGAELVGLLTDHGIPEKGARIYLAATRTGPQTAAELARVTTLHRVDAYRFIQQLTREGLLRATGGRPMRFAALPPEALMDRWIRTASERLDHLEQDRERILARWQESLEEIGESDPRKFTIIEGREATRRFLIKRIGSAERQILVSVSGGALARLMDTGVDRALKEAHARGVKVRVVTEVDRAHLGEAKHFSGFTELRHVETSVANQAVVIDRSGTLLFLSGEDDGGRTEEEQVVLWSSARAFIDLAREYHRRLWIPAVRAEERLGEIEVPDTATLLVVEGREREPFRRLKEMTGLGMRATGIRELQLKVPELIQTIARQIGRQIANEVEGGTPTEVARALQSYYQAHTSSRLEILKERPLTVRVTNCFACTNGSTEIGRVMCPRLLRSVMETRIGSRWEVSKPDPTRHATRGCVFSITAG